MKRRSLLLIILIVLLPVGLLTWLGLRVARDEQMMTQQKFRGLMEQRLQDVNRVIGNQFAATERRLQQITAIDDIDVTALRKVVRDEPQVTQLFVLSPDGSLLYPNPADALNGTELSFLRQASRMFTDRDLQSAVALAESAGDLGDFLTVQPGIDGNTTGSGVLGGPIFPEILIAASEPELQRQRAVGAEQLSSAGQQVFDRLESAAAAPPGFGNPDASPSQSEVDQPTNNIADLGAPDKKLDGERADPGSADLAADAMPAETSGAGGVRGQSMLPENLDSPNNATAALDAEALAAPQARLSSARDSEIDTRQVQLSPSADAAIPEQVEVSQLAVTVEPQDESVQFVEQAPVISELMREFAPASGWFVWYWDRGLNLVYWQRRPSGHIVGAALERARWIADLIAVLPDTDATAYARPSSALVDETFRVISSSAEVVYEWGVPITDNATPFCEIPLASPLASWRMQCFVPADQLTAGTGQRAFVTAIGGLSVFTITLTALAWLLYRDYSRDMREAGQQVSFVNQVSHELKTPLTNIRLYAELLERDLEQVPAEQADKPRRRLDIITAEAQRLSRLIGNVLTFARQQRKSLQLQPVEINPGDLVRQIAERFAPSLAEHGLEVQLESVECRPLRLDPDFVEQIVGNLISNVEKYAASGRLLRMRCTCDELQATIDVIDAGPGVPTAQRTEVFRPFARLSSDLRSSSGTGIGLSIARDLARLHGGDLVLMDSERGCWFRLTLKSQA